MAHLVKAMIREPKIKPAHIDDVEAPFGNTVLLPGLVNVKREDFLLLHFFGPSEDGVAFDPTFPAARWY